MQVASPLRLEIACKRRYELVTDTAGESYFAVVPSIYMAHPFSTAPVVHLPLIED